jgi:hypothetical protein
MLKTKLYVRALFSNFIVEITTFAASQDYSVEFV